MDTLNARLYEHYRTTMGDADDDQAWRRPQLRALIRAHFPAAKDMEILDLGCGSGLLLRMLREHGYTRLTGVDVSPEQVAIAQRMGADYIRHGDLFAFLTSRPDASVDMVISFDVLEHLENDALLRIADETFRILRPGGTWFIRVPNAEGVFGSLVRWADLTHLRAFTPNSIGQLARVAGFHSSTCHPDRPVGSGWKGVARRVLYAIMRIPFWLFWLAETGTIRTRWIPTLNLIAIMKKG
jgi:predicted TPR repeat methyltransferase